MKITVEISGADTDMLDPDYIVEVIYDILSNEGYDITVSTEIED